MFQILIGVIKRSLLALVALVAVAGVASAQHSNIVWSTTSTPLGGAEYELTLAAELESGYHIYGLGEGEYVNPTKVEFIPSGGVELVGEGEVRGVKKSYFDELFGEDIETYSGRVEFVQRVKGSSGEVMARAEWMICSATTCMPPDEGEFSFNLEGAWATQGELSGSSGSLWALLIEAILWGFAALLTPCVFPMIPMTISFFIKGEGGAKIGGAVVALYGAFIVALYTLPITVIILITRLLGGDAVTADIFNWLATHWLPNIVFFVLFMVFAASLLGAFEMTLPSWIVNRSDQRASRGSVGGIFFLALTLVLVSFSCTGPIVSAVLIMSTSGEFYTPIVTMLAFSVAFALPFVLFALFPSALKRLPKSGGWLNSVKVTLGFVEIALGLKFLSVADQTYHWGLLNREVYLAVWIVVFSLEGLYLLGKLRFKHDDELKYIAVGRLALSIVVFSFVVYLIPGMWGAPLKALSGYLPPLHTQEFVMGASGANTQVKSDVEQVKYSDFLHLPHGLEGFFDIDEAREYAAKVGKPLFVELTGHGCVNCREMQARVWSDERVLEMLRDDYVVVALYMDDKTQLSEKDWVTTSSGRVLKSLGRINAHRALGEYGVNAQPYYILESPSGGMLKEPRGYNLDVDAFVEFLTLH